MIEEKSSTFIQEKPQPPAQVVIQLFSKLNKTIDDLEVHVERVINKHEAEFLFAYRNHMKKIKKELSELKQRSDEQEKQFTSNDKIQYLEKQISIFRQQALKLYDKLEQKTKQCEELKIRLRDCEKQNVNFEKQTKELVKKVKLYELHNEPVIPTKDQLHQSQTKRQQGSANTKHRQRRLPSLNNKQSKISMYNKTINQIIQPYLKGADFETVYKQINQYVRTREEQFKERFESYRRKIPKTITSDNEIKDWFLDCVKTIKRQIYKRKQLDVNALAYVVNIDEFLAIDKLRLLQIFLSNEKLLSHMYLKIFPDRFSEMIDFLSVKSQKLKDVEQRKHNSSVDMTNSKVEQDYEFEELDKPMFNSKRIRNPKNLLRNKVLIKNGKLNFTNS